MNSLFLLIALACSNIYSVSSIVLTEQQLLDWNYYPTSNETVSRPDSNVDSIDPIAFAKYTKLRRIALNRNRLIQVTDARTFSTQVLLQKLDLSSNMITQIAPQVVAPLTGLLELYLARNRLTQLDAAFFTPLSSLVVLDISQNSLSQLDTNLFAALVNLRSLDISYNILISLDSSQFRMLTNLYELRLNGIKTKVDSSHVDANPNLASLHLADNGWTSIDSNIFQRARANIIEIDLSGNQLTTLNANLFSGLANVQRLYLSSNQIGVLGSTTFRSMGNLREIHLNSNKILSVDNTWFIGFTNLYLIDMRDNPVAQYFPATLDALCSSTLNPNCQVVRE